MHSSKNDIFICKGNKINISKFLDLESGAKNMTSVLQRKIQIKKKRENLVTVESDNSNKICIYIDMLQGYGADKVLLKIGEELVRNKSNIDFISASKITNSLTEKYKNIDFISFNSSRFNVIKNIVNLSIYLIRHKPSILFTSIHFNNVTCAIAIAIVRLFGVKTKFVARQANKLTYQLKGYPFPIGTILLPLIKFSYSMAEVIISPSRGLVSDITEYIKADPQKIYQIYNPTITQDIFDLAGENTKNEWFNNDKYKVILGVGRLKPQKDFLTLIKAFSLVQEEYPSSRLVILGEGPQRPILEKMIDDLNLSDVVRMPGFNKNPYKYIAKAYVFVLSSIYEGLPNTLIEALALNNNIISTNCECGPAEILKFGKYGKLIPTNNYYLLKTAIEQAFESKILNKDNSSLDEFMQKRQVEKYRDLFLSLDEKNKNAKLDNILSI